MVPATPMTSLAAPRSTMLAAWSRACSTSRRTAASSSAVGGSERMSRSVSRTLPTSIECAASGTVSPSTSSVDPPPMSTTSRRERLAAASGIALSAPRNDSRASSSSSMTSGSTPRISRTPSRNTSRFAASRVADVATKRIRSTRCLRHSSAYCRVTARVRARASSSKRPVRSTPCPRRTISSERTMSCRRPCLMSAMRRRSELVPQSKAATRVTGCSWRWCSWTRSYARVRQDPGDLAPLGKVVAAREVRPELPHTLRMPFDLSPRSAGEDLGALPRLLVAKEERQVDRVGGTELVHRRRPGEDIVVGAATGGDMALREAVGCFAIDRLRQHGVDRVDRRAADPRKAPHLLHLRRLRREETRLLGGVADEHLDVWSRSIQRRLELALGWQRGVAGLRAERHPPGEAEAAPDRGDPRLPREHV